jgi:hypothetical protein
MKFIPKSVSRPVGHFIKCFASNQADAATAGARPTPNPVVAEHPLANRSHQPLASGNAGSSSDAASRMAPRAKLKGWEGAIPSLIRFAAKKGKARTGPEPDPQLQPQPQPQPQPIVVPLQPTPKPDPSNFLAWGDMVPKAPSVTTSLPDPPLKLDAHETPKDTAKDDAAVQHTFTVISPVQKPHPFSTRKYRYGSFDSSHVSSASSSSQSSPQGFYTSDRPLKGSSSKSAPQPGWKLQFPSRSSSQKEQEIETGSHEDSQVVPPAGHHASNQAGNEIIRIPDITQVHDPVIELSPTAGNWAKHGLFVDTSLQGVNPTGTSDPPPETGEPSASATGKSVVNQLVPVKQGSLPLQHVLADPHQEQPAVPPGEHVVKDDAAVQHTVTVTSPVHRPPPFSRRTVRSGSHGSMHFSSASSSSDGSPRAYHTSGGFPKPTSSKTGPEPGWKLQFHSRSSSQKEPVEQVQEVEAGSHDGPQVVPPAGHHASNQASNEIIQISGITQVHDPVIEPSPTAGNWAKHGPFVDISLHDVKPTGTSDPPPETGEPSASATGKSVVNQLVLVKQASLPLQHVFVDLRQEQPAVPPGERALRLNLRFEQYVQREVNRPLDMPRVLECTKERLHRLKESPSEQNWDKAVQLYKKAFKLDLAKVEAGWRSAGQFYPLSTIPAGAMTLLPGLTTLPFSSIKPIPGAALNLGLQLGLAMVTPVLNAGFQNFFVNLQELKRVGGLSNRSPALAGASAPEFGKATENIEKALDEVDAALAALRSDKAGPAEFERAEKAQQQMIGAMQAYERRVDVNNLNYTGQFWQSAARTARQTAYFLAPVAGQYLVSQAAASMGGMAPAPSFGPGISFAPAPGPTAPPASNNGRYVTYGIQVAATIGLWIAQQFAAPRDEKNKQEATILATLKHTEVRKASAIEDKVAIDDLKEEHIDLHKFRDQWRGADKVRLTAVTDILQNRIAGLLSDSAKLVGLTPLEWVTLQGLESRRFMSPAPLQPQERTLLDEMRQAPHSSISRKELLDWMRLEDRARDPLSEDEHRQFSALEKKFKTSTMSEHAWNRLQELEAKSEANQHFLLEPEHVELEQLRERSASSLTVREHALLETLRIRRKFSPDAKDVATRDTLETKAGLNADERAVLARVVRHGDAGIPVSVEDFLAAGAARRKLAGQLDDKESAAYLDATCRISNGLTTKERNQYNELRGKGRFDQPEIRAELQRLDQQVQELRLDKRLMGWDWSKLSEGAQSAVDGALSGASDLALAWETTKARLGQRQEVTPQIAQRFGASFQMVIGGSTMPFIVGAGFRLSSALGKTAPFEYVRIPAGLLTLAIGVMGAWASGALINFKITERARLRKLAEEAPSTTQLLLSSIPRAMIALPAELKQVWWDGRRAANRGKQWLESHGGHLQVALDYMKLKTDAPAVPAGAGGAGGDPPPGPIVVSSVVSSPMTGRNLSRTEFLDRMNDLEARLANFQLKLDDVKGTVPHPSAVHPQPTA